MITVTLTEKKFRPAPVGFWGSIAKFWQKLNPAQKILAVPVAIVLAPVGLIALLVVSAGLMLFALR